MVKLLKCDLIRDADTSSDVPVKRVYTRRMSARATGLLGKRYEGSAFTVIWWVQKAVKRHDMAITATQVALGVCPRSAPCLVWFDLRDAVYKWGAMTKLGARHG